MLKPYELRDLLHRNRAGFLLVSSALLGALGTTWTQADIITDAGVYSGVASSEFSALYVVENLFDDNNSTQWVVSSLVNPQGRDEAWFSVELSDVYNIDQIYFAPRAASGIVDGINQLQVWIDTTPFGVDVTSKASTDGFVLSGLTPDLTVGSFASASAVSYGLDSGSPSEGRYLLAKVVNTTDFNENRNLGASTFLIGGSIAVPEPSTLSFFCSAVLGLLGLRRFMPRGKSAKARTL